MDKIDLIVQQILTIKLSGDELNELEERVQKALVQRRASLFCNFLAQKTLHPRKTRKALSCHLTTEAHSVRYVKYDDLIMSFTSSTNQTTDEFWITLNEDEYPTNFYYRTNRYYLYDFQRHGDDWGDYQGYSLEQMDYNKSEVMRIKRNVTFVRNIALCFLNETGE